MPRKERARSFLFEPNRYRFDAAVLGMSVEARGAYSILWCAAWDMPEPGIIEPATDAVLASLAMVSPECWARVAHEVANAFDTSQPGRWIQKGLRRTLEAQDEFVARQVEAGKRSAEARRSRSKKPKRERPSNDPSTTLEARSNDPPTSLQRPSKQTADSASTPSVLGSRFSDSRERQGQALPRPDSPREPGQAGQGANAQGPLHCAVASVMRQADAASNLPGLGEL